MTSNLYKVGDWVYCEVSPFQPFVVRKIEELTKTSCGNVEAKVICAYRYQDIPASVMATVEKYQAKNNESKSNEASSSNNTQTGASESTSSNASGGNGTSSSSSSSATTPSTTTTQTGAQSDYYDEAEVADLNEQQRYNLRHRELFFSKCTDTIAATTIRAKCSVLLFNEEIEKYSEYLSKEDQFYYHLTYDPYQKNLVADKGEIRVGMKYQAEVPSLKITANGTVVEETPGDTLSQEKAHNDRVLRSQLQRAQSQNLAIEIPISQQTDEILQWVPIGTADNLLTDTDIDKFLLIAKSVGTFARALDCNNAFKQPSLPLSAAAASREITLFHAMNALHDNNYDIGKAVLSLITSLGPMLCKDELEEWSAAEANLFEDALEKYGKDFVEIRKDYLPWKSMKSIIEYYYTWKTTDRYLQQKRIKLTEQESKLKQVYIPNHSKQNQSALIKSSHVQLFNQYDVHLRNSCESCGCPNTSTNQWYAYTPTNLVQHIMSGNTNASLLANAHAQAVQNLANSNPTTNANNSTHLYQPRVCAECWTYWKKFASFKFPNARQERLNQLKNQIHKCSVNGCGREFKMKQLLIKHCGIAHGYFAKTNVPPGQNPPRVPAIRNRTAFHLLTTPMTQAARYACALTIKLKKLARKPFKLVDLAELNKEWFKETRNIATLISNQNAKRSNRLGKLKLDVKLINRIHRARARELKRSSAAKKEPTKEVNGTNGTNGHNNEVDMEEEDDDDVDQLIIDNENPEDKPEFFKYFENKCTTPCYTPDKLAFPKPSSDTINKFHLNLITANRKRPLDSPEGGVAGGANKSQNGQSDTNESIPKRSLLSQNQQLNIKQPGTQAAVQQSTKQQPRVPQKSNKPTASINLPNSPEDIFYKAVPTIKTMRREIEIVSIRRLARKPYKLLNEQHNKLYSTLEKIAKDSLSKLKAKLTVAATNGTVSDSAEQMDNEESSSDVILGEKKSKTDLNGSTNSLKTKLTENDKNHTSSVVVLD